MCTMLYHVSIITPYLLPNIILLYTHTTFCLSMHWLTNICFSFSILGPLWVKLLWTFVYIFLCENMLSIILDIYLEVEFLGHRLTLDLSFWVTDMPFSIAATLFYIPSGNDECSNFSTFHKHVIVHLFCCNYPSEKVPYYVFDIYFPNDQLY